MNQYCYSHLCLILLLLVVMSSALGQSCLGYWHGSEESSVPDQQISRDGLSPAELGTKVADYVLAQPMDHKYTDSCAHYAILKFAEATRNNYLRDRVIAAYATYHSGERTPATGHVDNNLFGIVPLEIYRMTNDSTCLLQGKSLADEEWDNPRPDGLTRYTRWWLDDMYMVGCLQARAYQATRDPKYAERGTEFLLAYAAKLQQPNGLMHHGPQQPYYWVRGNGWAAAGMTEMLLVLPEDHEHRPRLLAAYQTLMKGLVKCQEKDGMWPQLLDYPHVRPESSGTGMYVFSIATGVQKDWIPEEPYRETAERGWNALTGYVDAQGRVREVSHGTFSKDLKPYLCNERYPVGDYHGQAAVLWAAAAMYNLRNPEP
ncbi:MAG: glycoside hydrolase family 88 protein [Pirellulales bacterium]|nr:glycoside hydrolase family 88 protein [Pirellulales bacterium]